MITSHSILLLPERRVVKRILAPIFILIPIAIIFVINNWVSAETISVQSKSYGLFPDFGGEEL